MFARISAFVLMALPLLAVASPLDGRRSNSCDTGSLQCCASSTSTTSQQGKDIIAALVNIPVTINGLIGISCTPISVIGGSTQCQQEAYCCTDSSEGTVSLGCTSVSV